MCTCTCTWKATGIRKISKRVVEVDDGGQAMVLGNLQYQPYY